MPFDDCTKANKSMNKSTSDESDLLIGFLNKRKIGNEKEN
jgi:hypothetical protein